MALLNVFNRQPLPGITNCNTRQTMEEQIMSDFSKEARGYCHTCKTVVALDDGPFCKCTLEEEEETDYAQTDNRDSIESPNV